MKLYIAEKKEVAKAIADAFNGKLDAGLFALPNGDKVTWLYGHLLRLSDPEESDQRYTTWKLDDLPMQWPISMLPGEKHSEHLKKVIEAIESADELVNAGDPDPEGQRLVDEVIEYSGVNKTVHRVLINDNNEPAIRKAVENMESNDKYQGLSMSALARAVGDQRYGYNLTRAYTLLARKRGFNGVLSVGRVQTPILGLVVRRDRLIEEHKAAHYFVIKANLAMTENPVNCRSAMDVSAQYVVQDTDPTDDKGRLIDKSIAENITSAIKGQRIRVKDVDAQQVEVAPPLPYNLLALQADAASKYGLKPKKVLEITQTLRDKHRAITYNRSDCRYLNDERHAEAAGLLEALGAQFPAAQTAEPERRSKAFNSAKVTAHHAIIPTASVPEAGALTQEEQQIYDLIVGLYIAQFYPPRVLDKAKVLFEVAGHTAGHTFSATSSDEVSPGWRTIIDGDDEDSEEAAGNTALGQLLKDDEGTVRNATTEAKKTQPLKRYTMSTLLKDLASAAKYVTDPHIKTLLLDKDADKADEKGGIGTPATRDSHIETLFTRGYISEKGKQIISTELGRQLIDTLPEFATTPDMTALWHEKQKQIEAGELDMQALLDDIDRAVAEEIERVIKEGLAIKTDAPKCPDCEDGYLQQRTSKSDKAFWGCTNYPSCQSTFPDANGKPDLDAGVKKTTDYPCPNCGEGYLQQRKGDNGLFWSCDAYPNCKTTFPDADGKPNTVDLPEPESDIECPNCKKGHLKPRRGKHGLFWSCNAYPDCKTTFPDADGEPNLNYEKPQASSDHKCPKCKKGLIRRQAKSGNYWWGCSGFPKCDFRAFDKDGKPEIK